VRGAKGGWGLGGQYRASRWRTPGHICRLVARSRRWTFSANAKKGAAPAKGGVRRVVEGVPFENTAFVAGTEILELAERVRHIRDAEFHLDLAVRATMSRHSGEYTIHLTNADELPCLEGQTE
jgi:hypothetical protein